MGIEVGTIEFTLIRDFEENARALLNDQDQTVAESGLQKDKK